jgi:hypothetical protein
MKKVVIYLPKGCVEYTTNDDFGAIANYVYTNYPDNLGFKVVNEELSKKLKR